MVKESRSSELPPLSNSEIYGTGSKGDKISQLLSKTPTLEQIGFIVPDRVVITQSYLDNLMLLNGFGDSISDLEITENTAAEVINAHIPNHYFQLFEEIAARHGQNPIIVRSSAEGDARGTGTYQSVVTDPRPKFLRKAFLKVLSSYFTQDAKLYRKDSNSGSGFAISIEDLKGNWWTDRYNPNIYFSPLISGFGYSSTPQDQNGFINVVPGLNGGVSSRNGEIITPDQYNFGMYSIADYLMREHDNIVSGRSSNRSSALLGLRNRYIESNPNIYTRNNKNIGHLTSASLDPYGELVNSILNLDIKPLFNIMQKMQDVFLEPQYFEWVISGSAENPTFWIVQIDDVKRKNDVIDFVFLF